MVAFLGGSDFCWLAVSVACSADVVVVVVSCVAALMVHAYISSGSYKYVKLLVWKRGRCPDVDEFGSVMLTVFGVNWCRFMLSPM